MSKKEPLRFTNKYIVPEQTPKALEKAIQTRGRAIELLLKWTQEVMKIGGGF